MYLLSIRKVLCALGLTEPARTIENVILSDIVRKDLACAKSLTQAKALVPFLDKGENFLLSQIEFFKNRTIAFYIIIFDIVQ